VCLRHVCFCFSRSELFTSSQTAKFMHWDIIKLLSGLETFRMKELSERICVTRNFRTLTSVKWYDLSKEVICRFLKIILYKCIKECSVRTARTSRVYSCSCWSPGQLRRYSDKNYELLSTEMWAWLHAGVQISSSQWSSVSAPWAILYEIVPRQVLAVILAVMLLSCWQFESLSGHRI
jgi:hypothetical protein